MFRSSCLEIKELYSIFYFVVATNGTTTAVHVVPPQPSTQPLRSTPRQRTRAHHGVAPPSGIASPLADQSTARCSQDGAHVQSQPRIGRHESKSTHEPPLRPHHVQSHGSAQRRCASWLSSPDGATLQSGWTQRWRVDVTSAPRLNERAIRNVSVGFS